VHRDSRHRYTGWQSDVHKRRLWHHTRSYSRRKSHGHHYVEDDNGGGGAGPTGTTKANGTYEGAALTTGETSKKVHLGIWVE